MKLLNFFQTIAIMLFLFLSICLFVSCSSDDNKDDTLKMYVPSKMILAYGSDDQSELNIRYDSQWRITSMIFSDKEGSKSLTFEYDVQGRWTKLTEIYEDGIPNIYTYTHKADSVMEDDGHTTQGWAIDENYLADSVSYNNGKNITIFEYDNNKRLVKESYKSDSYSYLNSFSYDNNIGISKYVNMTMWQAICLHSIDDIYDFLLFKENNINKVIESETTKNIMYELNNNGYPTRMSFKNSSDETITWDFEYTEVK
ncbi:hypothetical protein JGH11_07325 [Dysgonomonas sp. Marseille-P4677]|uniref:hypothetical protein n=1 Tax=Dysgonomonas sp. Marseille-P4677 TaxID=2364790 RepID=UPI001911BAC3|nr:hypothetical protein [Dysgonomonas sp. Marseille-P4677]MBK5720680.1 hypothetical protein [Dysgonomonas sp. Marseille-P4677]